MRHPNSLLTGLFLHQRSVGVDFNRKAILRENIGNPYSTLVYRWSVDLFALPNQQNKFIH
jgi:hypothetical protein